MNQSEINELSNEVCEDIIDRLINMYNINKDNKKEMHRDCCGYILSSVNDIPKENRQSKNWYLACSTSISEESARDIYKALLFKSL